jgi:primary-amine oxidase
MSTLHPFDTLTAEEIRLGVAILEKALPGVPLRYKRIDVLEPIKKDMVPYLDAERLGLPLPKKPARLLFSYFHRKDTGGFFKAVLNADTKTTVFIKELPGDIQVAISPY